jgi:hypothetical protein
VILAYNLQSNVYGNPLNNEEGIMETVLSILGVVAPTFLAIISLAMFTTKTRWFNYGTVIMAIFAELIPVNTNMTALLATIACLIGLFIAEFIHHYNLDKPIRINK